MVRTKPDSKQQGSHMLWRQCGVWTCLSALVAGWLLLGMALPSVAQQRPRGSGAEATASTAGNGYVGAPPVARHQFVVGEKLVYGVRVTVPSLGCAMPQLHVSPQKLPNGERSMGEKGCGCLYVLKPSVLSRPPYLISMTDS